MLLLESLGMDPYVNMAMEEYAFYHLSREEEYFILWQNRPAVIIGKHQNVREEVNLAYAREHDIAVVRRLSGGGAVYHDPGNLNFTYIVNGEEEELSMERFAEPLLCACREFGIEAKIEGRNDVTAGGRKFSGNAGYRENGRTMHHGTILLTSDKETMARVLTAPKEKVVSHGVKSVKSRVTDLSECAGRRIAPEEFAAMFCAKVFDGKEPVRRPWSEEEIQKVQQLAEERYASWKWTCGTFPLYELTAKHRVEGCGTVEVGMRVLGGCIAEISFRGDFIGSRPVAELEEALTGCRLERKELIRILREVGLNSYMYGMSAEQLADILCGMST